MPKMTTDTTVAGLNRHLRAIPRTANAELRDASSDIARLVAADAQGEAQRVGGIARLVAPSIVAGRDRVPVVKLGGGRGQLPSSGNGWERKRTGSRQTMADAALGAEFGGGARKTTRQFAPHRGTRGYFLWPTVRRDSDKTKALYSEALGRALQRV